MSVRYCSQHERLLSSKHKAWIDFPIADTQTIQALHEFFRSANIETSVYRVIETACDRCAEVTLQTPRAELHNHDPPP